MQTEVSGHGYVPTTEITGLQKVLRHTESTRSVARAAAADYSTYMLEFLDHSPFISFHYDIVDGTWSNEGRTLEDMNDSDGLGGDRVQRVLKVEKAMREDRTIEQAFVASEDVGFGRNYGYLYTRGKDNPNRISALAIEHRGTVDEFQRFVSSLQNRFSKGGLPSLSSVDLAQPLFFTPEHHISMDDIFHTTKESFTIKRQEELQTYLDRFKHDTSTFHKVIEKQELFAQKLTTVIEEEIEKHDDVRSALASVAYGMTYLVEEVSESRWREAASSHAPETLLPFARGESLKKETKEEKKIQQQDRGISSHTGLEHNKAKEVVVQISALERDENKVRVIPEQVENIHMEEKSEGKIEGEETLTEETSELIITFLQIFSPKEDSFTIDRSEDFYDSLVETLFSQDNTDGFEEKTNEVSVEISPSFLEVFQEIFQPVFPDTAIKSLSLNQDRIFLHQVAGKDDNFDRNSTAIATKEIVGLGEELFQFLQEEKFDTPKKEEAIGTMNAADEDQTEILQKLLALVQQETLPKEVRYITLVLLYKEMQKITMERGKEMPLVLLGKLKQMIVHGESVEKVAENVEQTLRIYMGKAGEISKEILEITPQDIFLGLIEGSEIIEHAPLLLDMEEKKKQIRKFIILSKLLYVINASGNGEKSLHFNKKLFYKSPFYLDVSIITLLNVLDIPKEIQQRLLLSLGIEIERLKEQLHQRKEEYDSIPYERGTISFEEVQWIPLQYAFHGPKNKRHAPKKSSSGYTVFPSFMILFDYSRDVYQYLLQ